MSGSRTINLAILTFLLFQSCIVQATAQIASISMPDVATHHWAHDAVKEAIRRGYFEGQPDGRFEGNQVVTRHEFAVVLARVVSPYAATGEAYMYKPPTIPTYTDVSPQLWSYEGITAVSKWGLMQGLPDHTFGGHRVLTRFECVAAFGRLLNPSLWFAENESNSRLSTLFYKDKNTKHWAYLGIDQITRAGLIEGFPDGTFRGERPLTRYQLAAVTVRIMNGVAIETNGPPK